MLEGICRYEVGRALLTSTYDPKSKSVAKFKVRQIPSRMLNPDTRILMNVRAIRCLRYRNCMRGVRRGFRLCFLFCFSFAVGDGSEVELTLGEAFRLIEAENLRVLLEREVVAEAFQTALASRSALLPSLDLQAAQLRTQHVNVGRGFESPNPPPRNRFDAKITGSVPLFDVSLLSGWRLAKFDHEISEINYEDAVQFVLSDTGIAFFTHQRNLFRVRLLDANIERDIRLPDLAKNKFRAGVATQIDVTRAEVQLASDQKDRLQQDTVVLESELRIKRLLNIDLDSKVVLRSTDPLKEQSRHALGIEIDRILDARPDFRRASLELERDRIALKLAKKEILPRVQLFGEWGWASSEILDGGEENSWLAGVAFRIPLFEGFRIRSNSLRAGARLRAQEYALRDLENQVASSYKLAVQDVESRFEQIAISEKKVSLSKLELELAQTRFREGVADNRDVIDAQAELAGSNDELLGSIFLFNVGRLSLARVRGDVRFLLED